VRAGRASEGACPVLQGGDDRFGCPAAGVDGADLAGAAAGAAAARLGLTGRTGAHLGQDRKRILAVVVRLQKDKHDQDDDHCAEQGG
jgi:hypothetical protein